MTLLPSLLLITANYNFTLISILLILPIKITSTLCLKISIFFQNKKVKADSLFLYCTVFDNCYHDLYKKNIRNIPTNDPCMFNCLSGPTSHAWMTQTWCNLLSPTCFLSDSLRAKICEKIFSENLFWTLQFCFLFRSSNIISSAIVFLLFPFPLF